MSIIRKCNKCGKTAKLSYDGQYPENWSCLSVSVNRKLGSFTFKYDLCDDCCKAFKSIADSMERPRLEDYVFDMIEEVAQDLLH